MPKWIKEKILQNKYKILCDMRMCFFSTPSYWSSNECFLLQQYRISSRTVFISHLLCALCDIISPGPIWLVDESPAVLSFSSVLWFVEKCYEPLHLKYYDTGESWGRIYMRNVELCTCLSGVVTCERARYTGTTYWNQTPDTWSPGAASFLLTLFMNV